MSVVFLNSVVTLLSKVRGKKTPALSSEEIESSDEDAIAAFHRTSTQDIALSSIQQRLGVLEDRFKLFQENLMDDSAYQTDVTDLTSWLAQMENKIAGNDAEITSAKEESDVDSGREKSVVTEAKKEEKKEKKEAPAKPKKEDAVVERLEEEAEIKQALDEIFNEDLDEVSSQVMLSAPELQATNEKLKSLAYNLNEQLHALRDKVFLVDHELKRMAKGVEFALMRAKVAGANEMVSSFYFHCSLVDFFVVFIF